MWGAIFDKIRSFKVTLGLLNILMVVFLFTWPYCTASTQVMAFIWVCLLFLIFSGNFAIFPTIITLTFGVKRSGLNIGMVFTSQVISAFIGVYVLIVFKDDIGWKYMCWLMAAIQFIGLSITMLFKYK